ncbi:MAG: 23S rRNA (adenine(2503)-C(2))-methyltransferase RlmN [Planctomycetia bacterium]|nr:23S rRNA (adenine(2503)-C(2))-methyltransferase RlmN [Planctomycetia bacterium]
MTFEPTLDPVAGAAAAPEARRHVLDPASGLAAWLGQRGQPAWRAGAIRRWLHGRRAQSFADMTDLPRGLRSELDADFRIWTTTVAVHQRADDGTEKLLLALADGQRIECVLLREEDGDRRTVCISSQVGCAMGCVFCASGIDGVVRNLTTGEIVEQLLRLALLLPGDERLSHIVVMGMGEPLANLDRLLPALAEAQDPEGLGISQRRITISTVGLPQAIDRLGAANPGYHLAVSLHAADDDLRTRLVPVNKATGLADVMAAADRYWETSGRRLTFEYVLLGGVNDSREQAERLARLLGGRAALVNVIPYNAVSGMPWKEPTTAAREQFLDVLRAAGVNVQVRRRKGARIDAACGQLRRLAAKF